MVAINGSKGVGVVMIFMGNEGLLCWVREKDYRRERSERKGFFF